MIRDDRIRSTPMIRPRAFTLVELLVVIILIGLLMALLLPALGAARRTAQQRQNDTQVRGLHQAMVTFAEGNRSFFPGIRANNTLIGANNGDTGIDTDPSGTSGGRKGNFVAVRHEILLDGSYITGAYVISPAEDKTEWTIGSVDQNNYSYAMLRIHYRAQGMGFAPNLTAARNEEWRNTLNAQAVVVADRNTGSNGVNAVSSIHTTRESGKWEGSVAFNDGRVTYETAHDQLDLKYGSHNLVQEDNLFMDNDGGESVDNAMIVYNQ